MDVAVGYAKYEVDDDGERWLDDEVRTAEGLRPPGGAVGVVGKWRDAAGGEAVAAPVVPDVRAPAANLGE